VINPALNKPIAVGSTDPGSDSPLSVLSLTGPSTSIPEDVRTWILKNILPLVEECRRTGGWSSISAARWERDTYFRRATHAVTRRNGAWYDMLQRIAGVTADEVDVIKKEARTHLRVGSSPAPISLFLQIS
jgi:hypothetical protein